MMKPQRIEIFHENIGDSSSIVNFDLNPPVVLAMDNRLEPKIIDTRKHFHGIFLQFKSNFDLRSQIPFSIDSNSIYDAIRNK